MPRDAADRFNLLGEPVFFDGVAALAGPGRAAFVADYAFDIRPATDDRPYFLDFFRWRALPALWEATRGGQRRPARLGLAAAARDASASPLLSGVVLILLPARVLARPTPSPACAAPPRPTSC